MIVGSQVIFKSHAVLWSPDAGKNAFNKFCVLLNEDSIEKVSMLS